MLRTRAGMSASVSVSVSITYVSASRRRGRAQELESVYCRTYTFRRLSHASTYLHMQFASYTISQPLLLSASGMLHRPIPEPIVHPGTKQAGSIRATHIVWIRCGLQLNIGCGAPLHGELERFSRGVKEEKIRGWFKILSSQQLGTVVGYVILRVEHTYSRLNCH